MRSNAASSAFLKGRDNDPTFDIKVNIEKQQHPVTITVGDKMRVQEMQQLIHQATGMAPNDQRVVVGLGTPNPREITSKDREMTVSELGLKEGSIIKVFGKSHHGK